MLNPNEAPIVYERGEPWLGAPSPGNGLTASSAKDKTVTISAELSDAYVELQRAVERYRDGFDWHKVVSAHEQVLRAGGGKS